ncbi:MAG: ABC transporter permease [Candidatus Limnocylindrales bacterium]
METSRGVRWILRLGTGFALLFVYVPLALIAIYAFNVNKVPTWPPTGFTLEWVRAAIANTEVRDALLVSLGAGVGATAVALVLGTLLSFAVVRYTFFGRQTVSFLVILPIALPGIVTAVALSNAFVTFGVPFGLLTIVIAHATFCIVVVYNNATARLRRGSRNIEEASMDLGADALQTFRFVTFPRLRSAMLAGALLAFALSFDEVIVTRLTAGSLKTMPLWILDNYLRPNQGPVVNVVAVVVLIFSALPVYLAQRLTADAGAGGGSR